MTLPYGDFQKSHSAIRVRKRNHHWADGPAAEWPTELRNVDRSQEAGGLLLSLLFKSSCSLEQATLRRLADDSFFSTLVKRFEFHLSTRSGSLFNQRKRFSVEQNLHWSTKAPRRRFQRSNSELSNFDIPPLLLYCRRRRILNSRRPSLICIVLRKLPLMPAISNAPQPSHWAYFCAKRLLLFFLNVAHFL
ncbi:hypothetical protein T05_9193 [Trichinella murrelli]|uniref:Uncharacterized protein n=1 Tax=Trichinella murrelli TaxID=144512 RepID=A0A0V0U3V1_9BILA|nr:hypothetical protein T05_9193 [Trichinella murrelli]